MVFDIKDYKVAKELILDIGKSETILWQGKMDRSANNSAEEPKVDLFVQLAFALLCFSLFIIALKTVLLNWIIGLIVIIGGIQVLRHYYTNKSELEKKRILEFTHYMVTEERILFLLYQREKIHLHFLPFSDIESVVLDQKDPHTGNLKFRTTKPVSFQEHFENNPTRVEQRTAIEPVPRFEQIEAPHKIAALIKRYL